MPFWQRLAITFVTIAAVSLLAGLLFGLPSYLAGLIGGLAALPVWEFLKRVGPPKH